MDKANPRRFRLRVENFDGQKGRSLYFADRGEAFTALGTEMAAAAQKGVRLQIFEGRKRLAFARFKLSESGFSYTTGGNPTAR